MATAATRPGAVIAYFGGRPYIAMRNVVVDFERIGRTLPDVLREADKVCSWITETIQTVCCECGATDTFSRPPSGGPAAAVSYFRTVDGVVDRDDNHLTIVRTAAPQPPCDDWHEIEFD